jgi:hypothetical protein
LVVGRFFGCPSASSSRMRDGYGPKKTGPVRFRSVFLEKRGRLASTLAPPVLPVIPQAGRLLARPFRRSPCGKGWALVPQTGLAVFRERDPGGGAGAGLQFGFPGAGFVVVWRASIIWI